MKSIYITAFRYGIHEVVRIDEDSKDKYVVVVQTNIRTKEKAEQACQEWTKREAEKNMSSTGLEEKSSQPS